MSRDYQLKYENLSEISSGEFATVFLATYANSNGTKKFATKRLELKDSVISNLAQAELIALRKFNKSSENVISLADWYRDNTYIYMVLDYCEIGDLFSLLEDEDIDNFTINTTQNFAYQVLNGIDFIHKANILHLDLKPDNIIVSKLNDQGFFSLKISDFGLSINLDDFKTKRPIQLSGTLYYQAPEQLTGDYVGFYTDMWSIGVIIYFLISGHSPFWTEFDDDALKSETEDETDDNPANCLTKEQYETIQNQIKEADYEFDLDTFHHTSEDIEAIDLINSLLQVDTEERLNVTDALEHDFITTRDENIPHICQEDFGEFGDEEERIFSRTGSRTPSLPSSVLSSRRTSGVGNGYGGAGMSFGHSNLLSVNSIGRALSPRMSFSASFAANKKKSRTLSGNVSANLAKFKKLTKRKISVGC